MKQIGGTIVIDFSSPPLIRATANNLLNTLTKNQ